MKRDRTDGPLTSENDNAKRAKTSGEGTPVSNGGKSTAMQTQEDANGGGGWSKVEKRKKKKKEKAESKVQVGLCFPYFVSFLLLSSRLSIPLSAFFVVSFCFSCFTNFGPLCEYVAWKYRGTSTICVRPRPKAVSMFGFD